MTFMLARGSRRIVIRLTKALGQAYTICTLSGSKKGKALFCGRNIRFLGCISRLGLISIDSSVQSGWNQDEHYKLSRNGPDAMLWTCNLEESLIYRLTTITRACSSIEIADFSLRSNSNVSIVASWLLVLVAYYGDCNIKLPPTVFREKDLSRRYVCA